MIITFSPLVLISINFALGSFFYFFVHGESFIEEVEKLKGKS